MTLLDVVIIAIVYMFFQGIYLILKIRGLHRGYKFSDYTTFLDFFEAEFIHKSKTWRRRYVWFYNSKAYFICLGILSVVSFACSGVLTLMLYMCRDTLVILKIPLFG